MAAGMAMDNRRKFIDSLLGAELETALSLVHPECVIRHPPVPYGGERVGPEGFREILRALNDNFELEVEKTEQLLVDDYLIVRYWATFTHKKTGRSTSMTTAEFMRFEDGLIVEMDNYYKAPERVTALMTEVST
jgi:ketosteroid isomerase-like protein